MTRRIVRASLLSAAAAVAMTVGACSNSTSSSTTSPTPTPTGPITEPPFSSIVYPSAVGAAWQKITVSGASGTVTATLVSTDPPGVTLGLGIGVSGVVNGCPQGVSANVVAGGQVSAPVDVGTYCIKIFDPGTLKSKVAFTVSIVHP
jgi:hypothetical protein